MIPVTESSLLLAANLILALSAEIESEFSTPAGQFCLSSPVQSWFGIHPRLCSLIYAQRDVECWLDVALSRGETRLPVPVPMTGTI